VPGHVLDSPWNQSFMADSKNEFDEGFSRLDEADGFYNNWVIPHDPYIEDVLKVITYGSEYYFEKTTSIIGQVYRYHNFANPTFQRNYFGNWMDINMKSPGNDWQAVEAYNLVERNRAEQQAFSQVYTNIQAKRAEIFGSFLEPAGFWN
jgi:hypothetical protein